ncbi:conserved Plasmodium protein, unknown function [Plasmodium chabaudi chabaudi]|uniref:Reticulocyte binding protein n=1 Tax=Plasmodium chabaudi chabaudi TaxID=31271 RepID=A0A1D3LI26_PLACU|nr:conserved Plasmodium protein, unknown function [Plasmodium chabaudi chabaudi]
MVNMIYIFVFVFFVISLNYSNGYKRVNKNPYFFVNLRNYNSIKNMFNNEFFRATRHATKIKNKLNNMKNIHVGELKIGKIYDIKDNNIYVKLKNDSEDTVIIKRENNYLLENELLYDYLLNKNLIDNKLYSKLIKKKSKGTEEDEINNDNSNKTDDCVVLIKEINSPNKIIGELYTNEMRKRKDKIYDKLNELKNIEQRIFIKILKNIRNKYYIVLINDCIKGYLLYEENSNDPEYSNLLNSKEAQLSDKKLSAYIIDANKKLEYVFLSLKKYPKEELENKIEALQHNIIIENLFENNYFKGEVSDFCNDGNNIIVKIFDNKKNDIKVKIKSHNIINTKNILRNFDYLKNKVINNEFLKRTNFGTQNYKNTEDKTSNYNKTTTQRDYYEDGNIANTNKNNMPPYSKKEYMENFKKFKEFYYGCNDADALKYINVDDYIYKKENVIYVRIINKTLDQNLYEGSMKNSDIIDYNIYELLKKISSKNNIITEYNEKLRYPSKVLGFFNNYVILSTKVLNPDIRYKDKESADASDNSEEKQVNQINASKHHDAKDIITVIEKRYIDYENLKIGDIFFCRFDSVKRRNIRNTFNLSNSEINKIFHSYFKNDKDFMTQRRRERNVYPQFNTESNFENMGTDAYTQLDNEVSDNLPIYYDNSLEEEEQENNYNERDRKKNKIEKNLSQQYFEQIFFEKHNIYMMRTELHEDTEYHLNKNKVDKNFKTLRHICDNYYSGINKAYSRYPSIREEYILRYLGKDDYKLYRKIVLEYFSSNENSYKELLQTDCEELVSSIFDLVFEDPESLTIEIIRNYNKELFEKVDQLNIYELNFLLKDLIKLKNQLYIYSFTHENKLGRMNLLLNNQKPIKKDHILNLKVDELIKQELLKKYNNIIYPIDYIKNLILKKKRDQCKYNSKMPLIYILADETINIYENSAKDVKPFTEKEIDAMKAHITKKRKNLFAPSDDQDDDFRNSLFDPENSQIRHILHMIKEDLEKQKKKNKLEEVDREYEEEQKSYTDATDLYKTYPELEEMNKLAEDMFYMKLPFVE